MNSPIERIRDEKSRKDAGSLVVFLLIDMVGVILFGLGWYSKMVNTKDVFHPLLANSNVQYGLIALGIVMMIWGGAKVIEILIKKGRSKEDVNR